jgi:hypothetical protein
MFIGVPYAAAVPDDGDELSLDFERHAALRGTQLRPSDKSYRLSTEIILSAMTLTLRSFTNSLGDALIAIIPSPSACEYPLL